MSQVTRLKELLFDNETQALEALSRRIDTVAGAEQLAREVIRRELDTVLDRVGTTERFTRSVTEVIDEALEQAEVAKHTKLSATIAPLVVTTIKTELRNSQDEMVEALYPITGRLVKAYVASAIKDLNAELNRKIEQNAFMLRLQSLTTGRSVAELALAGGRNFKVEELFLIRRGSGELIAHWPETAGGGREQMMSGILAAINAFANEAFAADENSLRQIDLDTSTVYLRGSPIYLLAAKCAGTPPHGIEQVLDDAFLVAIEKEHEAETLAPDAAHERQHTLLKELEDRVEQENQRLVRPQGNPLKMIAALILIPLIGWFAWSSYARYANDSTERQAGDVLTQTAAMQGYPARFEASNMGRSLRISGLAPSEAVKGRLLGELAGVLPRTTLRDELSVVPGSGIIIPDRSKELEAVERSVQALKADMTANAVRRAVERTDLRLRQSAQDLRAARSSVETAKQTAIDEAAAFTGVAINELSSLRVLLASPENTDAARIANYYNAYLDTAAIDAAGMSHIQPDLQRFAAIADKRALSTALGAQVRADVDPINSTNFYTENLFGVFVTQGLATPGEVLPYILQGGLGLPEREYYLSADAHMADIRAKYRAYIEQIFTLAGMVALFACAHDLLMM